MRRLSHQLESVRCSYAGSSDSLSMMVPSDPLSIGFFCVSVLLNHVLRRIPELLEDDSSGERTILVIDIGSSSIRCTPFTVSSHRRVRLVETCVQKIPFKLRDVSSSQKVIDETNPSLLIHGIMEEAVDKCIVSLRRHNKNHKPIHGIGMSTFAMNIFVLSSALCFIGRECDFGT